MSGDFLSRILLVCQHQFTWPRRDENGEYYQLCVNCGSKYHYDWARMRRVARVNDEHSTGASQPASRRCSQKSPWTPRERRLRHEVPVSFRIAGSEQWNEAVSKNLSRSGLLFTSTTLLQVGQTLELKLEMPKELTGESPAEVMCEAVVARVETVPSKSKERGLFLIACSINNYEFESSPISKPQIEKLNVIAMKRRHKRA
jgi:hypothetical protein